MATSEEAWKLRPGFLELPSRLNRDHDETGQKQAEGGAKVVK